MSGENTTSGSKDTTPTTNNPSSQQPSPIKSSLKTAIQSTNRALASLEGFVETNVRQPVAKGLQQGSEYSNKAVQLYEQRLEYGPHLVVGTAAVVGGIVSLRRGKFPGAVAGLLSGGLAYGAVYESEAVENAIEEALSRKS